MALRSFRRHSVHWRLPSQCLTICTHRPFSTVSSSPASSLRISDEVRDAVASQRPVVALETTIYTHGALGADLPHILDSLCREHGAVPATIGVLDGIPTVGLSPSDVERMAAEGARKVSRRDLSYLVGLAASSTTGRYGGRFHGGTTIAGTMILARLAGVRIFGTGGLGGVHRDGENTMDISADLTELGRTRMAVVSSGCKGFLDIGRTLECLETQGVMVGTFTDGRSARERVDFPAFWARESGFRSPFAIQDEREAAAMIAAQEKLGIESGLLFANPIPEEHAISQRDMEVAIGTAVLEAEQQGHSGSANTPFILRRIRELTDGRSVPANLALVKANVVRAAKIANELNKLDGGAAATLHQPAVPDVTPPPVQHVEPVIDSKSDTADILVAGSVALDLSCDYAPLQDSAGVQSTFPVMLSSNPARITQNIGGVGRNLALAANLISTGLKVKLCSRVAKDIAGSAVLSALEADGMDTSLVQRDDIRHDKPGTAQYVAVNGANKSLVVAMADMDILTDDFDTTHWSNVVKRSQPRWLTLDANWAAKDIEAWCKIARESSVKVAFEPVSVAKSTRLYSSRADSRDDALIPRPLVDIITPNEHELAAMHAAAKEQGFLESMEWFKIIDAFGIPSSGARGRFVQLTSAAITDAGIPVQTVQLLPYSPIIVTKLGENGVLLTEILGTDDSRLRNSAEDRYILSRNTNGDEMIGGVYMRLFPPVEKVNGIVSVNGAGDTLVGALIAGLAHGGRVDKLIDVAQKAARLTLQSSAAVSPQLANLRQELHSVAHG